tara:strand:- start:1459 stop:2370 length:912 start_codon:yes stop_codon:yes gene_type:complete
MRVQYNNLAEIFCTDIHEDNISFGAIPGTDSCYLEIKNIYKYPDRVLKYAESCQYTNSFPMIQAAPVLRTLAPYLEGTMGTIMEIASNSFGRKLVSRDNPLSTHFSYSTPESISYYKNVEPHRDGSYAGVIYLDDGFGTSFFKYKNHSITKEQFPIHDQSYPEKNNDHVEEFFYIEGVKNTFIFYDGGKLWHAPDFKRATKDNLKNGRFVQNFFMIDNTDEYIDNITFNNTVYKDSYEVLYFGVTKKLLEYNIIKRLDDHLVKEEVENIIKKINNKPAKLLLQMAEYEQYIISPFLLESNEKN